ncbi:hypothetical protein [Lacticaseibacillus suilingensis]|uniref:hypothetical protein n=1 Tax=Lacticaseibacillus suilingensis TaxID=2799577 RepID=UPI0022E7ADB1|nr:hypothetical protein [Lacticaseibacillus suilingensis]
MNEELKQHALRIAEILQKQGNPYQRIEITQDVIKIVSTDVSIPNDKAAESAHPTAQEAIFAGLSFPGPAVSLDEYMKHFDEYKRRCSN